MITDSEDRSMITELEQIIQTEEAKPEAERDENLIDDCIHEIAELKGVKADFSDEEIDRITDKLVKEEKSRNRKRFIRLAAGIAAAFVIVTGVTACAVNPALINWLAKVVRMPFGSAIERSTLTYTFQGSTKEYYNIEELLKQNSLDIYYPSILPNNIVLLEVEMVENADSNIILFTFSSDDYQYSVHLNLHDFVWDQEVTSEIEIDSLHFDVYEESEICISHAEIDGDEYIIKSKTIDDAILFIGGLKKSENN